MGKLQNNTNQSAMDRVPHANASMKGTGQPSIKIGISNNQYIYTLSMLQV
jgi:hypothetical protein